MSVRVASLPALPAPADPRRALAPLAGYRAPSLAASVFCAAVIALLSTSAVASDVSYPTGHLAFSNTLVTAQGRSLSLPINLSYSSGIKQGHDANIPSGQIRPERASWVGLGFDLDVPYIERTVRGGPVDFGRRENPL